MSIKYRPDIDGLRAIAVLVVLFFHTSVPGFSGGFVGVDIFFVISGFLITSIILKDIKDDRFSIANFYERRIRRIFPALFSMMAFTIVTAGYLFDPSAFRNFGKSIIATTLFCSNIFFWLQSGYFAGASLQKPLLHTWSLAVEEQFYIIFPIAILLIHKSAKKRYLLWVSTFLALSLAINTIGIFYSPSPTFYLVHARAWELLAGSIIAMGVLPVPSNLWLRNLLSVIGLGLIVYSVTAYTESTLFPGYNAIAPVLGASLIIYSHGAQPGLVNRALSAKPLVFIGLISYSLYLWHWPLVAFSKYLLFRPLTILESAAIICVSLVVATLSWKYIEQPFRSHQSFPANRKRLFTTAAIVMLIATATGEAIYATRGIPNRLEVFTPGILAKISNDKNPHPKAIRYDWEDVLINIGKGATPPIIGAEGADPCFALLGDSHANALVPAFSMKAHEFGVAGFVMSFGATPFLMNVSVVAVGSKDTGQDEVSYNNAVFDYLKQHPKIQTVFIASRWAFYVHGSWSEKTEEETTGILFDATGELPRDSGNLRILAAGLERTVEELLKLGRNVVLMTDVPEIGFDAPRGFYIQQRWPCLLDLETIRPSLRDYQARQTEANELIERLARKPGVTVVHPETRMFDANGLGMISAIDELLYEDDDHLSTAGALQVAPVLDGVFGGMAARNKGGRSGP